MYTIIYKNKKKSIISIALAIVISFGIILQGCTSELVFDDDILNSPELEEYIIAGADLERSIALLEKELSKIDFSKLEVSLNEDGKIVKRFPVNSFTFSIEEKIHAFNEKKEKLNNRHPEFSNFSFNKSKKYFQQCIKSSVLASSKLLEFGYSATRPILKGGSEIHFGSEWELYYYLHRWTMDTAYVEAYIIAYSDGTYSTWIDDRNTSIKSYISLGKGTDGTWYFPAGGSNSSVAWIAHTHIYSNQPTTGPGQDMDNIVGGIPNYIWYRGDLIEY